MLTLFRPFSRDCLNSVEVGIIVMVGLSIVSGLVQLTLYVYKYYSKVSSQRYVSDDKLNNENIASNRDNQVTLQKHTFTESTA